MHSNWVFDPVFEYVLSNFCVLHVTCLLADLWISCTPTWSIYYKHGVQNKMKIISCIVFCPHVVFFVCVWGFSVFFLVADWFSHIDKHTEACVTFCCLHFSFCVCFFLLFGGIFLILVSYLNSPFWLLFLFVGFFLK